MICLKCMSQEYVYCICAFSFDWVMTHTNCGNISPYVPSLQLFHSPLVRHQTFAITITVGVCYGGHSKHGIV